MKLLKTILGVILLISSTSVYAAPTAIPAGNLPTSGSASGKSVVCVVPGTSNSAQLCTAAQILVANPTATFNGSTTSAASINIPQGTPPSSPNNGDVWLTSTGLCAQINGVKTILAGTSC